ncbi:MAG TPA: glycosyltransferase family 25 protein [Rhizomicrobium sp.]|nr:glycosyltransferase family 25 protein [Rhizomicrobium sp.]
MSRIYVVSIPRLTERHSHILKQFPEGEQPIWSFTVGGGYDFQNMNAADLAKLGLFNWQSNSKFKWWARPLKFGEIACALNHLSCWEDAARRGTDFCVIFEDDVSLKCDFKQIRATISDLYNLDGKWDLLYLARSKRQQDLPAGRGFVRPGYSYGAWAYCLSAAGIRKLLAYDFRSKLMPSDEFLPATFVEHPRKDVAKAIIPSLRAYALEVELATLARFGSETEASGFVG